MQSDRWGSARNAWQAGDFPLTKVIIAANFLTMVLITFHVPIAQWLIFEVPEQLKRPWTMLTYPLVSGRIMQLLFNSLWLYFIGASLERSWGTRFYAIFFAVMSVIAALCITLGVFILHLPGDWAENWLPLSALTVTFCALNPTMEINIWGVVPIQARWLMIAEMMIVFFVYAQDHMHPLMGFFALLGCAPAYFWARTNAWGGVSLYAATRFAPRGPKAARKPRVRDDNAFSWRDLNPFERIARARRKKQFERLMKDD